MGNRRSLTALAAGAGIVSAVALALALRRLYRDLDHLEALHADTRIRVFAHDTLEEAADVVASVPATEGPSDHGGAE